MKINSSIRFISSGLFQVGLAFVFMILFFFFYVQKVENESFSRQIQLSIQELLDQLGIHLDKLPKEIRDLLHALIEKQKEEVEINYEDEDREIRDNNNDILRMTIVYGVVIFCVPIVFALIVSILNYSLPFNAMLRESFFGILFIGITEFIFLTFIISRYITADPNIIVKTFATDLKAYAEKQIIK